MMKFRTWALGVGLGLGGLLATAAQAVEIEYWQYVQAGRVDAMTALIQQFEAANPGITVKQETFPYADYQTKVAAAVLAGQGPDVVQFYYGWLDTFRNGQLIQPLDATAFPEEMIKGKFFSIIDAMKRDGEYYGLPTAVRALALIYNKKHLAEAGYDHPPATLDELVEMAKATTKHDAAGNIESEGIGIGMAAQDHHLWREVLVRQFGGEPYLEDYTKVNYNDAAGLAALKWYMDLEMTHKVAQTGFMDEPQAAFKAGRATFLIDGTFRIPGLLTTEGLEFGVAELPSHNGIQSNFASYWANGIVAGTKGEELEAANKFLAFVTTPEAMKLWLEVAGELPADPALAMTPESLADPIWGPFLKGLDYAHTTLFWNELDQRQVMMDMVNTILLEGTDPAAALAAGAEKEQEIINDNM
jgi:multiple sugar transport system substrate-binding protein